VEERRGGGDAMRFVQRKSLGKVGVSWGMTAMNGWLHCCVYGTGLEEIPKFDSVLDGDTRDIL